MTGSELFSIDVDAHLQKAATHTFSSPAHYPVELVRAAIRRGATEVDVRLSGNRIRVTDNGNGLDENEITILDAIMGRGHSTEVKEEAVENVQKPDHFGLLALFAASPTVLDIRNTSAAGGCRIRFQNRSMVRIDTAPETMGTDIMMVPGKHRDPNREKEILTAYCSSSSVPIRLNGKVIGLGTLLTHQLATVKVPSRQRLKHGLIGIPLSGDLCRIRLLDCRIPYRYVTLPAHKGFIFDAAIEYRGDITRGLLDHLAESSYRLYMWLCGRHRNAETHIKDRIEELMFTHYRLTGDSSFLHHFSPFKAYRSDTCFSLSELSANAPQKPLQRERRAPVRRAVTEGHRWEGHQRSLFAVPRNKEKLKYAVGSRRVLALTREQADFLINSRHIPITFLAPISGREKRLPGMLFQFKRRLRRWVNALIPTPSPHQCLAHRNLTPEEQWFIDCLNQYLNRNLNRPGDGNDKKGKIQNSRNYEGEHQHNGSDASPTVTAVMINSGGPFCALASQSPLTGNAGLKGVGRREREIVRRIFVRRSHPIIKKMVRAVHANPDHIELLIPLLPL